MYAVRFAPLDFLVKFYFLSILKITLLLFGLYTMTVRASVSSNGSSAQLIQPFLYLCLKARSHNLILRIRFLVPKIGSRRLSGPISRFRFCGENV